MSGRYVQSAKDLPGGEHWAILHSTGVHIPEQGVWAPGHGYPAHTENYMTYQAFDTEDEFRAELAKQMNSQYVRPESIRGIHVATTYAATVVAIPLEEKR